MVGGIQFDNLFEQSKGLIKVFLLHNMINEEIRIRVRYTLRIYQSLQNKFQKQITIRKARLELLTRMWDRMLRKISIRSNGIGDVEVKALCVKFEMIPTEVK